MSSSMQAAPYMKNHNFKKPFYSESVTHTDRERVKASEIKNWMPGEFKENWIKRIDPCSMHCNPRDQKDSINNRFAGWCKQRHAPFFFFFFSHLHIQGWIKQPLLNQDQQLTFTGEIYTKLNLGKTISGCTDHTCAPKLFPATVRNVPPRFRWGSVSSA